MNPPFLFLVRQKEKRAVHGPKRKNAWPKSFPVGQVWANGGRCGRCGGRRRLVLGCAFVLGNREVLPRIWGRGCFFRGWSSDLTSVSFRAPRFAQRCLGGSGKADSRSAERQRREEAGQIGPAPSDARKQSVAGGQPKISAGQGPPRKPSEAVFVGRGRASE